MSIKSVVRVRYIVLVVAIVVVIVTAVFAGPSKSAQIPAPINPEISSPISEQIIDAESTIQGAGIAAGEIILGAIAIS
jgi:hypothetical protein